MNAIQRISKKAKAIYKKHPHKKWMACIREASAQYRNGKLGATKTKRKKRVVKKKSYRQTGHSSSHYDRLRVARPPGKRRARKSKNVYYERRKNRSDMPGKLTGTEGSAYNQMVLRNMNTQNSLLREAETKLQRMRNGYKAMARGSGKKLYARQIKDQKKLVMTIKHELRMLKILIK